MAIGGKYMTGRGTGRIYRIVVRSELSDTYAVAFEGMQMEAKHGSTVLTGKIIDQPQLYGVLDRINGLGLELLSVEALPEYAHRSAGGKRDPKEPQS
jgi:hypothetical protein